MNIKHFIRLQLAIFCLIILFGILLLAGLVTIPKGPELEWFSKIWDVLLLVGNLAGLATAVKYADIVYTKENPNEKDVSTGPVDA